MKWKGALFGMLLGGLLLLPAHAAQFNDTAGHWASPAIDRWSGYGVVKGLDDGSSFGPNNAITRAEMATILSRVFGWTNSAKNTFGDMTGNEWYAQSVLQAKAMGVLTGDDKGNARPLDPITRQEAATMLSRAFHIAGSETVSNFGDSSEISEWAVSAVNGMSERGYIIGGTDGNFNPWRSITRAEMITIVDRIVVNYYNRPGSYSPSGSGVTVVVASGVTMRGTTLNGDLFIGASVANSEVILEKMTVNGQTYIQSGKSATVLFSNSSLQQVSVEGIQANVSWAGTVSMAALEVSGSGAVLKGLPENMQVTVTAGTTAVQVNGHNVSPGTFLAGPDISEDDDADIDVDVNGGRPSYTNTPTSPDDAPTAAPNDPPAAPSEDGPHLEIRPV